MQRRKLVSTSAALMGLGLSGVSVQTHGAVSNFFYSVSTLSDLKSLDPYSLSNNQFVVVDGFDIAGDGCGGVFYWSSQVQSNILDGVVMNSLIAGSWIRHFEGPIHTKWAGIKPSSNPASFDYNGYATDNQIRWNNLSDFCKKTLLELADSGKIHIVINTIFLDSGIHDFNGGTIFIGQGVGLDGNGPGRSVLRFNISAGTGVQVGNDTGQVSDESAFDIIKNISIIHHSLASTGTETGIAFDNTIRRCELFNVHVQGFNINVDVNAFGMDIRHCFFSNGYNHNLKIGPNANSMLIVGCRIDDQRRSNGGVNVFINHTGGARSIVLLRCDIQRSQRIALAVKNVASIAIRDCFFEGNNRSNTHSPDIWVEGPSVRNVVIDGCYFTGTGRFGSTNSRAINIRSDVTSSARFQITNNQQADNVTQGTFAYFIDNDSNTAMEIVEFNNIKSVPNVFPPNVVVKTIS